MKPEQIALSPALMEELAAVGIDAKGASMEWLPMADGSRRLEVRDPERAAVGKPAFTLADIITMLPEEIEGAYLSIDHRNGMYAFSYIWYSWNRHAVRMRRTERLHNSWAASPLQAAFGLLKKVAAEDFSKLILRQI